MARESTRAWAGYGKGVHKSYPPWTKRSDEQKSESRCVNKKLRSGNGRTLKSGLERAERRTTNTGGYSVMGSYFANILLTNSLAPSGTARYKLCLLYKQDGTKSYLRELGGTTTL